MLPEQIYHIERETFILYIVIGFILTATSAAKIVRYARRRKKSRKKLIKSIIAFTVLLCTYIAGIYMGVHLFGI